MGYRKIRNHEAAHAVVAIHFGVPFNRITQYKVHFPIGAELSPHFKSILAAGCLGEFYEEWAGCIAYNEHYRNRGVPEKECITPIEIALTQFTEKNYPEDFSLFTSGGTFNKSEYEEVAKATWSIVLEKWNDIETLSHMVHIRHEMSYAEVLELLKK